MRVGLFHSTLPEEGRKPGGVEKVVHRLGEELAAAGHEVRMHSFTAAPRGAAYDHVRLAPARAGRSRLGRMVVAPLALNRLDTSGLDVLHLHGDDWFYVRRRVPTVRTFHGFALSEARHSDRLARSVRQAVTVPLELLSSRLATAAYGVGAEPAPLYRLDGLLHNGVTLPAGPGPAKSERPTILFVGTWNGRKRGRFLSDVFQRDVAPALPEAELWMVSDRCEERAGVRWFGTPADAELWELFARAWAFCLPSTYEGFGVPYIEAMAHGTPVVASPNPGSEMVLEGGRHGLLLSDAELGAGLVRLLEEPGLRARLAEAGRSRAEQFAWRNVVEAHENAYREALGRAG
jgi:phosphatidyl-myo-inositol alpha-mannosyltransferase